MRMLFTQDYATSTAMVAVAALATTVMSVAEVGTVTRLAVVVAVSVSTMVIGNLVAAWRRDDVRWDPADGDDDAS
jgi:hypothetical protein